MGISFDKALGMFEHTLQLRSKRAEVLAQNIANNETPGFLARDMDFSVALKNRMNEKQVGFNMARTHSRHIDKELTRGMHSEIKYKVPHEPTIDGNTVDEHREKVAFAKNSLDFQASFRFLNGRFKGLLTALKGE